MPALSLSYFGVRSTLMAQRAKRIMPPEVERRGEAKQERQDRDEPFGPRRKE